MKTKTAAWWWAEVISQAQRRWNRRCHRLSRERATTTTKKTERWQKAENLREGYGLRFATDKGGIWGWWRREAVARQAFWDGRPLLESDWPLSIYTFQWKVAEAPRHLKPLSVCSVAGTRKEANPRQFCWLCSWPLRDLQASYKVMGLWGVNVRKVTWIHGTKLSPEIDQWLYSELIFH